MAFANLRRKPNNRSDRAHRYAMNVLRKVDQRGNCNAIEDEVFDAEYQRPGRRETFA